MSARNDITGDPIASKAMSREGRDNWDAIFRKKPETAEQQDKLAPCPFCKETCTKTSKPYVALYDEDQINRRHWGFVVRCPHCESQGPRFSTSEEAEEGWNAIKQPL